MNTAVKHDPRILLICQCCDEHASEGAVCAQGDIAVMPDGTWLCDECYRECDKASYGLVASDVTDFEFPEFEDLPRPVVAVVIGEHKSWQEVIKQPDERPLPTYGQIAWDQLGRDVWDATTARRTDFAFDPNTYPGHQMVPGINFNSLARIVDKYRYYGLPCVSGGVTLTGKDGTNG